MYINGLYEHMVAAIITASGFLSGEKSTLIGQGAGPTSWLVPMGIHIVLESIGPVTRTQSRQGKHLYR